MYKTGPGEVKRNDEPPLTPLSDTFKWEPRNVPYFTAFTGIPSTPGVDSAALAGAPPAARARRERFDSKRAAPAAPVPLPRARGPSSSSQA